jgi:hypothetical protein
MKKSNYITKINSTLRDEFKEEVKKQKKSISGALEEAIKMWLQENEKNEK